MSPTTFDEAAADYDAQLSQGLAITGEDKEYFAERRMIHLASCLDAMAFEAREVLDFGCGTGTATPYFFQCLRVRSLWGLDVSDRSLQVASANYRGYRARFLKPAAYEPRENVDLVFCNGVFHHIPIHERDDSLRRVLAALRPEGLLAFWENNPWNPGTRYVMSRVPFDRDAIVISPRQARRILRQAGFEVLRTDFLFFFPAILRGLRGLERRLVKLPLGGQYQVLCRKPAAVATAVARTEKVTATFCLKGPEGASHKRWLSPFPQERADDRLD
jgi:SAM-dependent methyltransferase